MSKKDNIKIINIQKTYIEENDETKIKIIFKRKECGKIEALEYWVEGYANKRDIKSILKSIKVNDKI